MPASEKDVNARRHLAGLLLQEESLDTFVDWFIHALWDIEHRAGDEDIDLAWRIENRLAERSSGYVTDAELLAGLRDDAREFALPLDRGNESESVRVTLTPASAGLGQSDR
jgi:hypothetical protein